MCGIAGIVYNSESEGAFSWVDFAGVLDQLLALNPDSGAPDPCGPLLDTLEDKRRFLTEFAAIATIFASESLRNDLRSKASELNAWEQSSQQHVLATAGLSTDILEAWNAVWIRCRDLGWAMEVDALSCVGRIDNLTQKLDEVTPSQLFEAWKLAVVLENIGRMEVRGRDSLGLSLTVYLSETDRAELLNWIAQNGLDQDWAERRSGIDFVDRAVLDDPETGALVFTYKVAQEVGALGDNVRALYQSIRADAALWRAFQFDSVATDLYSHTRWASNGIISEPNCHPVDEATVSRNGALRPSPSPRRVTCCLNGDVDNYQELVSRLHSETGRSISSRIGTDAKIIPVLVDYHFQKCQDMTKAFCQAVSECEGSIAVVMQNTGEAGRTYLALRGSGQSLFVGLCDSGYVFASELYGVVEQTSRFIRMDGTGGQVLVLQRDGVGRLEAIEAYSFDGEAIELSKDDVRTAEITTRDIDRKDFVHYLHKEISESPLSVSQTLKGKFSLEKLEEAFKVHMHLGNDVIPQDVLQRLANGQVRRIYWIGQGTAAVAGQAVANIMDQLFGGRLAVHALKATELSGYLMGESMEDALVIAISQSGTTTDTNRTVDMARERGAAVLGIVNRRNSDLVYRVNGVLYTSDGRDIEMSVASTKAFYSQVVAGYLLTYQFALHMGVVSEEYVYHELEELQRLPAMMRSVLEHQQTVRDLARKFAPTRRDWAVVGSGSTRAAADEIRIKLAELCYKSIATDHIEDKKHIDLSSEPLTLICTAGLSLVALKDAVKEVAIFRSHKSIPIVVASEGFDAFEPYASGVVYVPKASQNASVLLNVIVGHLWGYYCALAIDEGAERLRQARSTAVEFFTGEDGAMGGGPLRRILVMARQFQQDLIQGRFNSSLSVEVAAEMTSLLGYLGGARSLRQFSEDFQAAGTPRALAGTLITVLSKAIHELSRPIDAIKHQAKTITVGISRLEESFEGPLFAALKELDVPLDAVPYRDSVVLRIITRAISEVRGATCYAVDGLGALGEPRESSTVKVLCKVGAAKKMTSRADDGQTLVGNKERTVRSCSLYLGLGSRDQLPIAIVPIVPRGLVEKLALLHLKFIEDLPLADKVSILRELGQRYEDIKSLVTESDLEWQDGLLESMSIEELVTQGADDVAEKIVASLPLTGAGRKD